MHGILNINKPPGKTSFDIVAQVRRLAGERRVGHAGTLDPLASGVLPVCLGQATRLVQFISETSKTYRAELELGIETDTYDAEGKVTGRADPSAVTLEQLQAALNRLRDSTHQVPPMYSAMKHKGKPLYLLARAGVEIERPPRPVHFYRLEMLEWRPPRLELEAECSAGTYIRSLAHDLGRDLGCGAHLTGLVRLRCGPFSLDRAVSMPELEEAFRGGHGPELLYPPDEGVLHWDAMVLGTDSAQEVKYGRWLGADRTGAPLRGERCRAYTVEGDFLALLTWNAQQAGWHPDKVFAAAEAGPVAGPEAGEPPAADLP